MSRSQFVHVQFSILFPIKGIPLLHLDRTIIDRGAIQNLNTNTAPNRSSRYYRLSHD